MFKNAYTKVRQKAKGQQFKEVLPEKLYCSFCSWHIDVDSFKIMAKFGLRIEKNDSYNGLQIVLVSNTTLPKCVSKSSSVTYPFTFSLEPQHPHIAICREGTGNVRGEG